MVLELVCLHNMTLHKDRFNMYMLVINASCIVVGIRIIRVKTFLVLLEHWVMLDILKLRKNLISLGTLDSYDYCCRSRGGVMKVTKRVMVVMKWCKQLSNIYRLLGTTIVGGKATVNLNLNSISCSIWGWVIWMSRASLEKFIEGHIIM